MPSFDTRSRELELTDAPGIDEDELRRTLDELEVINRLLGGYPASLRGIESLIPAGAREISVLDVGTGGGDLPRRLPRWAARRGLRIRVHGIDLSPLTIDYARAAAEAGDAGAGLDFSVRDLFDLPDDEQYDVVHAALFLHHCDGEAAGAALRKMHALARWGVVINDLHRHPLAYHSIRWLTRLLSSSRLIRNDAPLSVLRAFRREDLLRIVAEQGLPAPDLRWRWPFRWQMVLPK